MSVSIEIVPLSPCVEIHGSPEAGLNTAYSLSGHVLISLSSTVSLFDSRPRSTRLLLSSLELTFEGKSEVITGRSGYAGARIISQTKQLLPDGLPVEITNEGHEDSVSPASWQVIFNLTLPGWLPASSVFGEDDLSSVSYSLFARATYRHVEDDHSVVSLPWKLASLCTAAIRARNKTVCAKPVPIYINRSSTSNQTLAHYNVRIGPPEGTPDPTAVPAAVLTNVHVLASLPAQVSTTSTEVPISLRVRSTNDPDVTARLRIVSFHVDLEQHEKLQSSRSNSYGATFPVPRSAEQPPHRPLLDAHPFESLYSMGIMGSNATDPEPEYRSWSLVPRDHPLLFRLHERALEGDTEDEDHPEALDLSDDDASSAPQGLILGDDSWHKVAVTMPIVPAPEASTSVQTFFDDDDYASPGLKYLTPDRHRRSEKKLKEPTSHDARRILRPSFDSPFYKVRHEARITITCSYRECVDGPEFRSEMKISLPLKFVCTRPADMIFSESSTTLVSPASSYSGSPISAPSSYPRTGPLGTNLLPAYSQLFHANGDSRDEVYADLPAYSKNDEQERLLPNAQ